MKPAEFDGVAAAYDAQHAASIRLSGEDPAYFHRYKIEAVAHSLNHDGIVPKRILDFGAGIGNSLPHLQSSFPTADITCLDVSRESLAQCSTRAIRPMTVLPYDGRSIPCSDGEFDLVFTACVFHHIDACDHLPLLGEIRRVLSHAGRFAMFEHNPWNPLTQHAVRTCPFDENAVLISGPEMRRRLAAAGFDRIELDYRVFFPAPLARLRPLERSLAWLPIGAQYSLIAS
ncbi:class I SAM-dependent methyltransferase [Qipengyuania sp. G39]|uniref:Class I SAM-dependent methyltransferase n=1 Tax=Qipengyuania profundimaris TaxID=3067652 RepID=A0ABT9HRL7_9SPHN|nr:class I SAM-dependent methyltransferase [Qipengyuania sp. G39]MDP4575803.1 class I SAM-dependent methyltransferase [Qipengyuania sp. G39]